MSIVLLSQSEKVLDSKSRIFTRFTLDGRIDSRGARNADVCYQVNAAGNNIIDAGASAHRAPNLENSAVKLN